MVPLLLAACSTSSTVAPATTTFPVPTGWKSATLGRMALAVPRAWVVKHDSACPNGAPAGVLLLAGPVDASSCTAYEVPGTVVGVMLLRDETSTTSVSADGKPVDVNGVPVYVGFGSPSTIVWTVPALGVQITGSGPEAGRVMHTLHRT